MPDSDFQSERGLSETEASRRLSREGYNELPSAASKSFAAIAFGVFREPMFILLVGCGGIYLSLGSLTEALLLLFFVFVIMGITLSQERKTERALESLRDLSSPRALVVRDGRQERIPGRNVVRDDILLLSEGDRVPADAVVLSSSYLNVDESLLTGESVPVRKMPFDPRRDTGSRYPGGEDQPFIFSGTLVVQGHGMAKVVATGIRSEIGKIGKSLQRQEVSETFLQKEVGRLVRTFASSGLLLCIVVIIVYGITRSDWMNGFLAGITLAMAILPEEFPVVLTVFLAIGAWRISRSHVLTRRIPAVETLGSASVLCVDKTGTLTLNRMAVHKLFSKGKYYDIDPDTTSVLPETFHELTEFALLASQRTPSEPMEIAIWDMGDRLLSRTEHIHYDWTLVREYPLSRELLAMSQVWMSPDGKDYVIAVKGAPEAIADLCHFDRAQVENLEQSISRMGEEGLRVLGAAKAFFRLGELPGEQHDFSFEFLGLIGFSDPLRPGVADAVKECYEAGIRVTMITGDYAGTAVKVARQIGLKTFGAVLSGPELDRMNDYELREKIKTVSVFSRVVPEQKLRIVNALKANGEVVAMTGDGVNDAPALKAAHIGIAMGKRGTDVAREAAALVLLDDDFSSIVRAVKMGRRIFDNLQKAMAYIFAIHVPIAGMSLLPVALNWPLVLLPVHIVFLELIIDPACTIVFEAEPEEANVMHRPPRPLNKPIFGSRAVLISLLQGVSVLGIVLLVDFIALLLRRGALEARTLTFTTLIVANLALIITNRSWSRTFLSNLRTPNTALWMVLGGGFVFLGLVLNVPFLRFLFRFNVLHPVDYVICLGAGVISVLWFEALKAVHSCDRRNTLLGK